MRYVICRGEQRDHRGMVLRLPIEEYLFDRSLKRGIGEPFVLIDELEAEDFFAVAQFFIERTEPPPFA